MVEVLTITLFCHVLSKFLGKELGANVVVGVPVSESSLEEVEAVNVNTGQGSGLPSVAEKEDVSKQTPKTCVCVFPFPTNAKFLLELTMDACGLRTSRMV